MSRLFDDVALDRLEINTAVVAAPPFTFGGWFYADAVTASSTILFVGDKDVDNRFYLIEMAGSVVGDPVRFVRFGAEGVDLLVTTTGATVNTWHHGCGIVRAANDVDVLIDGGSLANSVAARTPANWDRTSIGRNGRATAGAYFSGRLAELFVYNVALTTDEVVSLAGGVSPLRVRPVSLASYWPVSGVVSPEPDYRGVLNMTVNGTVVVDHAPVSPQFGFDLAAGIYSPVTPPAVRVPRHPAQYNTLAIY